MSTEDELRTGFDPDARELCPDGACIGVIGADGRCGECGKASQGKPKSPSAQDKPASDARDQPAGEAPPPTASLAAATPASSAPAPRQVEGDAFDPTLRELCPDGACIGVIGSNGRCKECGKASAPGGKEVIQAPPTAAAKGSPDPEPPADPEDREQDADDGDDPENLEQRQLCSDGACIGVIGSNGRCKECGTRAD